MSLARIYKINSTSDEVENIENIPRDLEDYSKDLIEENYNRKNRREFILKRDTVETKNLIDRLQALNSGDSKNVSDEFGEICDIFAAKLIDAQKKASERYAMINLREGNVIFYLEENGFLISKIDRSGYLNGVTYLREIGLPEEKPSQKIAYFNFDNEDLNILLSDSNNEISGFWFDDFLDLKPLNSSEKNTKKAFRSIESFINRYVTKKSKADGVELRNNLIGYVRTNNNFAITEAKDYVFGSYQPHSADIDMTTVINNFDRLYTNNKKLTFDTQFEMESRAINSRIKQVFKVKENVELKTNGYVEDLRNDIISIRDKEGRFHLQILDISSEAYENFKR